jgi:Family of unknown function (DUF6039)
MAQQSSSVVQPAAAQTELSPEEIIHSGSAGVIVHRTGQLKHEFRSKGRDFARQIAEYTNTQQRGIATVFLYEEQFGTQDRLHWLIHLNSLADYLSLIELGATDDAFRDDSFSTMFLDGTFHDEVLVPHAPGMLGEVRSESA